MYITQYHNRCCLNQIAFHPSKYVIIEKPFRQTNAAPDQVGGGDSEGRRGRGRAQLVPPRLGGRGQTARLRGDQVQGQALAHSYIAFTTETSF
jgi:hypothetical protein